MRPKIEMFNIHRCLLGGNALMFNARSNEYKFDDVFKKER